MAYYFREPINATALLLGLETTARRGGEFSVHLDLNGVERQHWDFEPEDAAELLEVLGRLQSRYRVWLAYEMRDIGEDYFRTINDACRLYVDHVDPSSVGVKVFARLDSRSDATENFIFAVLWGFADDTKAQEFREKMENKNIVI